MTPAIPTSPRERLLAEEWEALEAELWPDGPAHGTGSNAYAAHKERIEAAATRALAETERLADALRELGVSEATLSDIGDGRTPTRPLVKLSLTRAAPISPELWRTAYARVAAQYAVFLERYDLAEDVQADEIVDAIEAAAVASERARLREAVEGLRHWRYRHDHDEEIGRFVDREQVLALLEEQP